MTTALSPAEREAFETERTEWSRLFDAVVQVARAHHGDEVTLVRTVLRTCALDLFTDTAAAARRLGMVAAAGADRLIRWEHHVDDDDDSSAAELARALVHALREGHAADAHAVLREATTHAGAAGVAAVIVRLAEWVA